MNKKTLALAVALTAVASMPAHAADDGWAINLHPYVGGDYQHYSIDYKNSLSSVLEQDLSGYDVHVGVNVNKYFGAEVSYLGTEAGKKTIGTADTSVRLSGYALDAFGYLPIADQGKLNLVGTIGISDAKAELKIPALHYDSSKWETKGRIGAGIQYAITPQVNVRGLVRYQAADYSGFVDHAVVSSIGLNYVF